MWPPLRTMLIVLLSSLFLAVACGLPTQSPVCQPSGSIKPAPDCHDVPHDDIVKPLFPPQFKVSAPGFINFPINNGSTIISLQSGELTHYLDSEADTLKYDGRFNLLGPIKLPYNFTHKGQIIYNQLVTPGFCVCNFIGTGIFKYDAFADAIYKGRETLNVEYGVGDVMTDHYLKEPGHNLWMDVATGFPIRFFQEGTGLSVYIGWELGPPGPAIMTPPDNCIDVGGCRSAEKKELPPAEEHFVSPLDHLIESLRDNSDYMDMNENQ